MQDAEFMEKMTQRGIKITEPLSGAEATAIIREALAASPEVIARAQKLIAVEE
jgi:hypothetical protein